MRKNLIYLFLVVIFLGFLARPKLLFAKTATPMATASASPTIAPLPTPAPDLTQKTESTVGPLEKLLKEQKLGPVWPLNPLKYAIRTAVAAGVPANTIVLLLLLPVVAAIIAAARHLIGLRGFGIFLPAALSVVFVATGPLVGIGLFLVIVAISVLFRLVSRKLKLKLQYLPRMALILWLVTFGVLGVLFLVPVIRYPNLSNVSIFAVLILTLLAEDFTRVQLGKSARVAITLTTETLILALVSYGFLTLKDLQNLALLYPEPLLVSVFVFDFILGKYSGLRLLELYRFRKLINS